MTWLLIGTPECRRMKQTYFKHDEKQKLWYFYHFLCSTLEGSAGLGLSVPGSLSLEND